MTLDELLNESINENLIRMVFSKPKKDALSEKMKVRPVIIRDELMYQVTNAIGSKDNNTYKETHENLNAKQLEKRITESFPGQFLQGLIETEEAGYTLLAGKKGNITIRKNSAVTGVKRDMSHNRTKKYLIEEGVYVPFMEDLGVMNRSGLIVKSRYDKFRQINRYLEFVDDVMDSLPKDRELTIIDFGCGKSYLTFALYYYLVCKNNMRVRIIGLDLKTDVIKECNRLKKKYGYDGLEFLEGDIEHFEGADNVDMVISLHACDTATDYAIYKGILWNATAILAVPCCQHELNRTMKSPKLKGVTEYGILKDRLAAIFTDAMRANLLKEWGYDTQVLEFIDMEHTPKNILIRAVKGKGKMSPKSGTADTAGIKELAGADITLERLLKDLI